MRHVRENTCSGQVYGLSRDRDRSCAGKASMPRNVLMWIVAAVVVIGGFFGYQYWRDTQSALPTGIASGNGRIEAKLVDIAAKEAVPRQGNPRRRGRSRQAPARWWCKWTRRPCKRSSPRRGSMSRRRRKGGDQQGDDRAQEGGDRPRQGRGETQHRSCRERAGSQRELDVRRYDGANDDGRTGGRSGEAAHDRAGGQSRGGERRDDPDAHRRRDAQVSCHGEGALSAGRGRRGLGRGRQGAHSRQSQRRLHGNLLALRAGREDQGWRGGEVDHRRPAGR